MEKFHDRQRSRKPKAMALGLAATLLLATISGCAQSSSPEAYNGTREWSTCSIIGAVAGAAIGWGLAYGILDLTRSGNKETSGQVCVAGGVIPVGSVTCTVANIPGHTVPVTTESRHTVQLDEWVPPVAAIPGAIIGAVAGHFLCDPIFQSPYKSTGYPPPPPPPAPAGTEGAPSPSASSAGGGEPVAPAQ